MSVGTHPTVVSVFFFFFFVLFFFPSCSFSATVVLPAVQVAELLLHSLVLETHTGSRYQADRM